MHSNPPAATRIAVFFFGLAWSFALACGGERRRSEEEGAGSGGGSSAGSGAAGAMSAGGSALAAGGASSGMLGGGGKSTGIGGMRSLAPLPSVECAKFGELCQTSGDCCSGLCDPASDTCASVGEACGGAGTPCASATDCCGLHCSGEGTCSASQCLSDGQECSSFEACCSGQCTNGECAALNPECRTSGNQCTDSEQCCSQFCSSGICQIGSSFCTQPGDVCGRDAECCTGLCQRAEGSGVGSCASPPTGSSNCSGAVDGTICNGCGQCCSRLCAPFGRGEISVCQPASGCHVNGDLCRVDSDCCGGAGSGLPGDGNVVCQKEEGASLGICRNPMGCNPQGNVCHFQDYACSNSSSRNNCCAGNGNAGVCRLDSLGVPRCDGLGGECRLAGETCASSADCCEGRPCTPGDDDRLRCYGPPDSTNNCVPAGGSCTINGDCCPNARCIRPAGSTVGACGVPTDSHPPADAGAPPGGSEVGVPESCALYGQLCGSNTDCCDSVPCSSGSCLFVIR